MYNYYATNIILDVYISFCVLCALHETACIIEKNGGECLWEKGGGGGGGGMAKRKSQSGRP